MLILPVVVHLPNLFGSAARTDKINLRLGDAVDAAAQPQDNLVGKAVRNRPRHILAGFFVVLLAQHLRIDGVAGIVEPAVDHQPPIGRRQRAEGHHGRVGRRRRPLREVDLLRRSGRSLRRHALRHQVEDAGVAQIIVKRGVKSRLQCRRLRIGPDRLEISRGNPDALVAQVRAGMNPVLRRRGQGCQCCQNHQ